MPLVCTIHQPSAALFEFFDRLLLVARGGKVVYFGDMGENSSTLLNYFERSGARPCSESENPAEYILEVFISSFSWFSLFSNNVAGNRSWSWRENR
jgi:ATP-binding cassette subfamily G (WHITE) protein 2 (SNQ2)